MAVRPAGSARHIVNAECAFTSQKSVGLDTQPVTAKIGTFQTAAQENAKPPMLVTLLGIVMLVKLLQSPNAPLPMLVTLLGIVMLVKLLQLLNTPSAMLVTLFGIVMLVKLLHA